MLPDSLMLPATQIAEQLVRRRQTVAVAESTSGGMICAALLSVPGASAYYHGGTVTYTRDGVNVIFAGATEMEPGNRGACEPYARYLAASVRAKLGTDWGVSEAGAAGPAGNRYGDPAGHTWLAVGGPDGFLRAEHLLTGNDDRPANMEAFAAAALNL